MKFNKPLRDAIRGGNLYIRATTKTTNRTLHAEVFYIKNNKMHIVGTYKSSAIGMSRMFDIFRTMVEENGLKVGNMEDYTWLDNGQVQYHGANVVRQSYRELY